MYQLFQNKHVTRSNLLLSKDYWMKDNSAKECFACGKPFTAFRRKHHCRLCGQIFCNSDTTLVSGERFDHDGTIRLCQSCLHYEIEDSSDEDDEEDIAKEDNDEVNNNLDHLDIQSTHFRSEDARSIKSERPASIFDASDHYSSSEEDESSMTLYTALHSDSMGNLSNYSDNTRAHGESNLRSSRSSYSINQVANGRGGYDRTQPSLIRSKSNRKRSKSTKKNYDEVAAIAKSIRLNPLPVLNRKEMILDSDLYSPINSESPKNDNALTAPLEEKEYMYKELNGISRSHITKFLRQTLLQFGIKKKKTWCDVIQGLLESVELMDPNPKAGDSFDITRFIKVKKIMGSTPNDSSFLNGLVFTNNVALKSMRTTIVNPNVIIITFPLSYARATQTFISLDQVLAQEKEYLNKLVNRITSLRPKPDVLISGSTISGYALELLDKAEISVCYNVKLQVIDRLSRVLEADIVGSMEKLASSPSLGSCGKFEVKTFVYKNTRKTLMFFSECQRNLGCTLLIRGDSEAALHKIKNIVEFLVYMMFHLKLETFLFRNQYIGIPKEKDLNKAVKHLPYDGFDYEFIKNLDKKLLSISPTFKIPLPYLLVKSRECEKQLNDFIEKYEHENVSHEQAVLLLKDFDINMSEHGTEPNDENTITLFQRIVAKKLKFLKSNLKLYTRQWETFFGQMVPCLEVSFHQSMSFLYSTTNLKNQNHCIFPKIIQMEYYMDFTDIPLGRYIEELISTAHNLCHEGCGAKLLDHYKSYVHGDGAMKVTIEDQLSKIEGLEHVILMWSTCNICDHTTPVIPMNETSWKFSLGKFLELNFLSIPLKVSFGPCSHDFKSRVKYFGLYNLSVKFEYEPIELLDVIVPGDKVYWRPETDAKLKIEMYHSIVERTNNFFKGVLGRLEGVKIDSSNQDNADAAKEKVKQLIEQAVSDQNQILDFAQNLNNETSPLEYLKLDVVLKELQTMSVSWDLEFSRFEEEFLPSENDITRITAFQLKNFFKEKKPLEEIDDEKQKEKEKVSDAGSETSVQHTDGIKDYPDKLKVENDKNDKNDKKIVKSLVPKAEVLEKNENSQVNTEVTGNEKTVERSVAGETNNNLKPSSKVLEKVSLMEAKLTPESVRPSLQKRNQISKIPMLSTSNLLKTELINRANNINHEYENSSKKMQNPKVAKLRDYYDQMHLKLNKEFVLERENERKKIANRYRANPLMSSKPIVEIYQDFEDAVHSKNETEIGNKKEKPVNRRNSDNVIDYSSIGKSKSENFNNSIEIDNKTDEKTLDDLNSSNENIKNFNGIKQVDDNNKIEIKDNASHKTDVESKENSLDEKLKKEVDIPQQETKSLLSTLRKFWADRSVLWKPLDYPLKETEHVFVDSDVIIREDEPTSLISFFLSSKNYSQNVKQLRKEIIESLNIPGSQQENFEISMGSKTQDKVLEAEMLKKRAIHLNFQIMDGSAILSCKVFFAGQFEALREASGSNFIQSLSRCIKWDSSGGKSGSAFLKTLDDRLVIKELSESEFDSFVKMAPSYLEFVSQSLFHDLPSVISKIYGFYQIIIKNPNTGRNMKMNVIIMENLFYNRKNLRIFDLKGSMRNRHVEQTGKENEVLLDENMVDYIYESPLFVRLHSKKILKTSLWNDTLFLSKMNVMDYSLVIGIDIESHEIVAGIIDYIRTFTWDKKLESWVKEKALVGGGGKRPTVVTPKQYKFRFRAAMDRYMLLVPDKFYSQNQL